MKKIISIILILFIGFTAYAKKTDKIGLIINKDLYPLIKSSIDTYINDLKTIEGIEVPWVETSYGPQRDKYKDLWNDIKTHYQSEGIDGVIFIGDLPIVDCGTGDFNPDPQCDLYWMDLDENAFSGSGPEFSSYVGSGPEIWMSRVTSSYFETPLGMSEDEIVNSYFNNVSLRMHGGLVDEDTSYCIIGDDGNWPGIDDEMKDAFYYTNVEVYLQSKGQNRDDIWKKELEEGHEYFFVFNHSNYNVHLMSGSATLEELYALDCKMHFGDMYACLNSRLDYANMVAAYGLLDEGLNCTGSGKSGSIMPGHFHTYTNPMNDPDNLLGDAWKIWWQNDGIKTMSWTSAMVMEGVGTLRLRPYPSGPYLNIVSPAGGEELEQNSSTTIRWSSNIDGNVKIELLKASGDLYKELAASIPASTQSFKFDIDSNIEVGNYKIRINAVGDTLISESDVFKITEEYIITSFPYVQDFNAWDSAGSFQDKWTQDRDNDDIDWVVWSGPTPSKVGSDPDKTGPDGDYPDGKGNYIYVEASDPNNPNKTAVFTTPKFNLEGHSNYTLSFYAHMFSANNEMGKLTVSIEVDGNVNKDVITLEGDHQDKWFKVEQDLSNYKGKRVRFIFNGTTGASWCSDICVDQFEILVAGGINSNVSSGKFTNINFNKGIVSYSISSPNAKLFVYDVSGRVIRKDILKTMYGKVNLSSLGMGVYVLKLKDGVSEFRKKIIITK